MHIAEASPSFSHAVTQSNIFLDNQAESWSVIPLYMILSILQQASQRCDYPVLTWIHLSLLVPLALTEFHNTFFRLISSITGSDSADDGLMKVTSQILGVLQLALSYHYKILTNKMHISKIYILIFNFVMSSTCFESEGSYSGRRLYKQLWYGRFYMHQYKQSCR